MPICFLDNRLYLAQSKEFSILEFYFTSIWEISPVISSR